MEKKIYIYTDKVSWDEDVWDKALQAERFKFKPGGPVNIHVSTVGANTHAPELNSHDQRFSMFYAKMMK